MGNNQNTNQAALPAAQQTDTQATPPTEPEHVEVVPIEAGALEAMERATIDVQITTAKKYPRSISKFIKQAGEMVSVDQETALSCIYRRPVGKEGGRMTYAEGESIRLAEIVAACYGNLRIASVATEINPRFVKVMGFAHDLETNYAVRAEVIESTVKKNGQPYGERMRLVVVKAAQSKAIRDAIFRVVPKSLCKPIINLSRQIALGEGMTMEQRRARASEWVSKLAVEPERIFAALGVEGVEEMGENHLLVLTGVKTAITDGDITADEAFPPLTTDDDSIKSGVAGLKERLVGKATPDDPELEAKKQAEKAKLEKASKKAKGKGKKSSVGKSASQEKDSTPPAEQTKDEVQEEAKAESPNLLYKCNSKTCGIEFDEPELSGSAEAPTELCPKCLGADITRHEEETKKD